MKLYATTTSERASKGQGGNRYLDIDIYTTNREKPTHHVHVIVSPDGGVINVSLSALHFGVDKILATDSVYVNVPTKGEKQKDDIELDEDTKDYLRRATINPDGTTRFPTHD